MILYTQLGSSQIFLDPLFLETSITNNHDYNTTNIATYTTKYNIYYKIQQKINHCLSYLPSIHHGSTVPNISPRFASTTSILFLISTICKILTISYLGYLILIFYFYKYGIIYFIMFRVFCLPSTWDWIDWLMSVSNANCLYFSYIVNCSTYSLLSQLHMSLGFWGFCFSCYDSFYMFIFCDTCLIYIYVDYNY